MSNLSWNEIRERANAFYKEWKNRALTAREEADAQDFQTDFLNVFGVSRRLVADFEHRVKIGERRGYIDLFWKGYIMIEMKSPNKDKIEAYKQVREYYKGLPSAELPRGILISDFLTFDHYDMDNNAEKTSFKLEELPDHVERFAYLAGHDEIEYQTISEVDIKAAELMGELYDALKENKYPEHQIELYLVRLMFCLFADDSGIFDKKGMFYNSILNKTKENGSDLASHIGLLFEILNKEKEERQTNIDKDLQEFPYIDGRLFEKQLETAAFNSKMRKTLLKCCELDWSQIKPEIFGAMFQSIKDKDKRRALGEHYTSEANILKVIKSLFLDDLWSEFEKIKKSAFGGRKQKLQEFQTKLQNLKFLDPACGCGNFLVVTYREIRVLEIEVLDELLQGQQALEIKYLVKVNVDQFYGIEIEEFPARIAQTAMWIMDHLMNNKVTKKFARYMHRFPLEVSPSITIGNALTIDWKKIVPQNELSYILGNPPFVGSRLMDKRQKDEVVNIFGGIKNCGELDYVTCWYKVAAEYIQGTNIEVAFVSTNSICQGLQTPILWNELMNKHGIKINFAHQTFKWSNEAKGKAAVYCVIVGFGTTDRKTKHIFQYATVTGKPKRVKAKQINAYLVDGENIFITSRSTPLCDVPKMNFGNMPADGGELLFTTDEKKEFLKKEPGARKYFKRLISAQEFINNGERWCLWLVDANPSDLRSLKSVYERLKRVRDIRLKSARPFLAKTPYLFAQITQPEGKDYILIPRVSSETRKYIPIGFFDKKTIAGDTCLIIPDGTLYHFGVLTSTMHMDWMRYVCGRLKSDYRYSKDIVYNNFPWPSPTAKQKLAIEKYAQEVLDVRAKFPNSSLADLYAPLTMPPILTKAHQKLDNAVDCAYGKTFNSDAERVSHLFYLYQQMTEGMFAGKVTKKKASKKK